MIEKVESIQNRELEASATDKVFLIDEMSEGKAYNEAHAQAVNNWELPPNWKKDRLKNCLFILKTRKQQI